MGETQTGVSLMRVVPKMDSGPVIDSEMVEISSTCTGSDLRLKLANACVPLMTRSLPVLANGNFSETEQDESRVTYCRKLRERWSFGFFIIGGRAQQPDKSFSDLAWMF